MSKTTDVLTDRIDKFNSSFENDVAFNYARLSGHANYTFSAIRRILAGPDEQKVMTEKILREITKYQEFRNTVLAKKEEN